MTTATKTSALSVSTPNDREVLATRMFDAPRDMVWAAHTKPELVRRWMLGPPGWSMPVCEIDLRVGGAYRYVWRNDADGNEFGMSGVHHEVVEPARIVTTERFGEDEAYNTLTFTAQGSKTLMSLTMRFASKEKRDAAIATGMTDGMEFGYQRLDDILTAQLTV